jgi:hypothetical protein
MLCINDAMRRFERTYKKIVLSGLINNIDHIYVNCVGDNKEEFASSCSLFEKVKSSCSNDSGSETDTLNILKNFCINNPDGNVLYLHSKGVTKTYDESYWKAQAVQSWIDCMEYFLIEKHEDCLKILLDYDNCGINYIEHSTWAYKKLRFIHSSHYSGNFWWSRNAYIAKRPDCSNQNRWHAEMTFLQPALSRYYNLFNTPNSLSPYNYAFDRNVYTNTEPLV